MPESGLARPSHDESVEERTITDPPVDFPTDESTLSEIGSDEAVVEPIPMYMVGKLPKDDSFTDWSSNRYVVHDDPVQIAGDNRNRTRLFVQNHSMADNIFLLRKATDSTFTGYRLNAGGSVEMFHSAAVWARCDDGDAIELSILDEFTLDDDRDE